MDVVSPLLLKEVASLCFIGENLLEEVA